MTTQTGTSHFVTRTAANRYYRAMGFTPADVGTKLAEGEIHIGAPPHDRSKGERLVIVDSGTRYAIERPDAEPAVCTGNAGKSAEGACTCSKCGATIDPLTVFPGGICLNCHEKRFNQQLTIARLTNREEEFWNNNKPNFGGK